MINFFQNTGLSKNVPIAIFGEFFFLAILGAKNKNSSRSPQYPEMLHFTYYAYYTRITRKCHKSKIIVYLTDIIGLFHTVLFFVLVTIKKSLLHNFLFIIFFLKLQVWHRASKF